jgi:hypothetical protein
VHAFYDFNSFSLLQNGCAATDCALGKVALLQFPFVNFFDVSEGNHHLAWSVPMSDPSYNIMGAGIHR